MTTDRTDLTARLARLGQDTPPPPTGAAVDRDVARGRAALRRQRHGVGIGAAAAAAVAAAGGYLASVQGPTASHEGRAATAATTPTSRASTRRPARPTLRDIRLVAYRGQEPAGFDIGMIPSGYDLDVQASTPNLAVLAPAGDTNTNPDNFVGKLVVSAESVAEDGGLPALGGAPVAVHGGEGRISDDGTATQVRWQIGSAILDAQCWDTIGLSHAQVVDFADSVTPTPQLQLSHG